MKTVIGMIVLVISVYYGAKQGFIKGEWLGSVFGLGPSADQVAVDETVKNTNRGLPRMVNGEVSFDRVTANKEEVILHYRLVNHDQMGAMQKFGGVLQDMQGAIVQDLCASKDIRDHAFERGHNVQIMLRSNDAKMILKTYVRPSACRG